MISVGRLVGDVLEHPGFFACTGPYTAADVAERVGASLPVGGNGALRLERITTLADAGPNDLAFLDNRKYLGQLRQTGAGAVLIASGVASETPEGCLALVTPAPYHAFAKALAFFYPESIAFEVAGGSAEPIAASAKLEDGVIVEPGAVIGAEAEIGAGTRVCANAVIGRRCRIGRDGVVGPGVKITNALIGDRVILHSGVCIGQDGFGFALAPSGHLKVPQIGRVIIQDDVEIGANTAVDRGALKDTVIGAGTKIDNLVQIGHNVLVGRNCVIVAHVGIAGSTELGDFVVIGGNVAVAGHLTVGTGAQIGGGAQVKDSVPPGVRVGGYPARPLKQWARELAWLKRGARRDGRSQDKGRGKDDAGGAE